MEWSIVCVFASLVISFLIHGVQGDVCERTWNLYEDVCFKYFNVSIVQAETRENCNSRGARLLTALTPRLKDFLVLHMDKNSSYWCVTQTGEIDSSLLPSLSKVSPLPMTSTPKTMSSTVKTDESCYYFQDQELHLGGCNEPRGFICERDSIVPPSTCPKDTEKIGTHCFWKTSDVVTKVKAAETCYEKGGRLANLETRRQRTYAIATVALRKKNLWVAGKKKEGKIQWENGEILDPEKEKFYVPVKDEDGNCVILGQSDASESGTSWIFGNCSRTAYGLCEKDAVLTPITMHPTTTIATTTPAPSCPGRTSADNEKNGTCYWETTFETPRLNWETAREYCRSYGGDLASYRDAAEEEIALGYAKGHRGGLWMGLRRDPNSNVFRYSDGSTLTYTNWAPGQPNLKGNLKLCVAHTGPNSTWEVMYCGIKKWFLCKIPKDKIPSSPPKPPTEAPLTECTRSQSSLDITWVYHQGYCYALYQKKIFSWELAKRFCQDNGGFLASLHSFDEINFLLDITPYYSSGKNSWLGLRARGLRSPYRWDDGTPFDFVSWDESDSYDDTTETDTCVAFETASGFWKKTHCNQMENVICKAQNKTYHTFTTPVPTSSLPGYCPDGWYAFGNKCYLVFGKRDQSTWSEAKTKCSKIGSELVAIHSQEEQDFLVLLLLIETSDTWIGMYSTIGGRLFHWTDNSTVDFTNWDSGEPTYSDEQEECVHLVFNLNQDKLGKWNDHRCTMRFPFICQIPKDPMLTKPGRDAFRCSEPEGWIKLGSSCYQIFNEPDNRLTWLQAQTNCLSVNSNLASIRNFAVSTLLRHHLTGQEGLFWIGMTDTTEHSYHWVGTSPSVSYTNWLLDQPKQVSPLRNCVVVDANGKWMVRDCDESHPFICEETKNPPTVAPHEPDMECPNTTTEWQEFGGKFCYLIEITDTASWLQAAHVCFKQGGVLASFHSAHEMEAVLHRIKESKLPVHIGFAQKEDGTFGWFDGSAIDYVNWSPGEPNDANEMCVEMHSDTGTWNDVDCSAKRGYVCSTRKVPRNISTSDAMTDKRKDLETKINAGGIVGIVVCVIVLLFLVAVCFYYLCPSTRVRAWRESIRSAL